VVIWCKSCGAFLGIHQPAADWSIDRNGTCQYCAIQERENDRFADDRRELQTAAESEHAEQRYS
jgi:hypothetical protein